MNRQRLHIGLRVITLLGLLLSTFLVPGMAQAPDTQPLQGEGPASLPSKCGPQVYFDIYHDVGDSAAEFTALAELVTDGLEGVFDVKDQVITEGALANYNVLFIPDPEYALTPKEIAAIAHFVARGGRLIILGERFGAVNTAAVNDLLAGVGANIQLNADEVIDPTNYQVYTNWPVIHQFAPHPLTNGVGQVALYASASLSVEVPALPIATGDSDTYVSVPVRGDFKAGGALDNNGLPEVAGILPGEGAAPEDIVPGAPVVMAFSLVGSGSVFVTGDSGLWTDEDPDADGILSLNEYDNRTLAHNVFDYPRCPVKRCYRILFDETHGWANDPSVGDYTIEAGFSKLAEFLRRQGHSVTSLQDPAPVDYATLRWYDVLVLMLPQEAYSPAEKQAIAQFVNEGGRLVTISENGFFSVVSRTILNDVHAFLGDGLFHNADFVIDPTDNDAATDYWPIIHNFASDPVNHGVGSVVEYAGSSLQVSGPAHGTAFGDDDTYVGNPLAEAAESDGAGAVLPRTGESRSPAAPSAPVIVQARSEVGAGDVYAIGDANLWDYGDYDADGIPSFLERDNAQLAHNVFAAGQVCQGRPSCHRILFDETHGWASDGLDHDYTIEEGFSELATLLRGYGHIVEALQDPAPLDIAALQRYDVLVLMLPQEAYSPAEKAAIGQFVNRGGRLVTIAEWNGFSDVSRGILNDLHTYLGDGLSHNADVVFDPSDHEDGLTYWPVIHTFAPDAVNQGVGAVVEYASSSLQVLRPAYGTAFGDEDTYVGSITAQAAGESGAAPSGSLPAQAEKGWVEQIYTGRPAEGETNGPTAGRQGSKYIYHGPQAGPAILIYADDFFHLSPNTFLDQALQALGLSYTAHTGGDWTGFETDLTSGGPWDLVLVGADNSGPIGSPLTALNNYVQGGGKLVLDDWFVFNDPGNPLWATLGFTFVSNDEQPPDPVYWWKPAHPFFNTPQSVPQFTALTDRGGFVYGQHVGRQPGFEALAGYTTPGPDPDQAALIVGNEGRTVFKGFLDFQNDANLDGDALLDGVELWINLISSMLRVTVQARSRVGAGDVFAIGDANLWDKFDWDGNGSPSLFDRDNARLAHNVFGFGELCEKCPVALFKDQDPWGPSPVRAPASSEAAVPEIDKSRLDAAGNLPAGTVAAPLAPEALGDVVKSFPAPVPGFVGLEWVNGYLWASGENRTLYKLNPANGTILETLAVPGAYPCGLAWDGSTFWISDCAAERMVQVDLTGAVVRSFPSLGTGPVGVAWDGTALWDVDYQVDQLHRIDPFSGALLRTIPAPDTRAAGVAWDGHYLWTNGRNTGTTYQIDPNTGAVVTSFPTPPGSGTNYGNGAAFDGMYLWVANVDNQTIYQIDVAFAAPAMDPNERVLRRWGIPYDVFGSADMGAVDLQPYCKVVVASMQSHAFYQTLSDERAWFEDWIKGGGMFELNGACEPGDCDGLPMPGGFSSALSLTNSVTVQHAAHPILHLPNTIPSAELVGWNWSTHGYLVDVPPLADRIVVRDPSGEPATVEFRMERGCVLATQQTLEWAWRWRFSPLLENMILFRRCTPAFLFLPDVAQFVH